MDSLRPKSHTGDYNIKRRFGKGFRNSKKSIMIFSSNKKGEIDSNFEDSLNGTPNRSCSLNALHTGQVLLQPRMAQLETLEAKMARIENSLSTTPRKKKISSSNNSITSALVTSNTNLSLNGIAVPENNPHSPLYDNSLKSASTFSKTASSPSVNSSTGTLIYKTSKDIARELEALKNALRDKENVIDSLKGQLNTSLNFSRLSTTYLQSKHHKNDHSFNDKQAAEDRLQRLKHDVENKSLLIKNIKLELERLDITDNIDVRIKQAELEYQLGREELNLLSIIEEIQSLKIILEEQEVANHQCENTMFSYVHGKHTITLHASEIVYDPKSPRFGASIREDTNVLVVDWSTEDSGLVKGDLLLEINGKLTLGLRNREDMSRLLSVSPNPAQLVAMRFHHKTEMAASNLREELDAYREKAGEAERIRDSFRSDNVRLTHRISYLEEQVAELLTRASKSDMTPSMKRSCDDRGGGGVAESAIQIFQKGPKVTLIGNVSPNKNSLKIRDTLPTVSNKLRSKNVQQACKSMDALSHKDDCSRLSESMCSLPMAAAERKNEAGSHVSVKQPDPTRNRTICYMNYQSPNSSSSSAKNNKENYCSMNERRLRYIKEAQSNLMNGSSYERTNHRHFKDDRSCKSVDFDSEPNYQSSIKHLANGRLTMYDSETSSDYSKTIKYPRPIPPQKPLRLSLHKGSSLQSVKIIDRSNGDLDLKKRSTSQRSDTNYEHALENKKNEKWC